jgi:hypothetical protein
VTIPPLQINRIVAMHVSHAKRFNHFVDARTSKHTTEGREETNKRGLIPEKLLPGQFAQILNAVESSLTPPAAFHDSSDNVI